MRPTYRLGARASYARRAAARFLGTSLCALIVGCAGQSPPMPPNVSVAARTPADFPTARPEGADAVPEVVAARFSSLDVPLGSTWSGDVVATTNARAVALRTDLFDVAATRVSPGRFHFAVRIYDLPAFLVRPYVLHLVVRSEAGRATTLVVPFDILGRTAKTPVRAPEG